MINVMQDIVLLISGAAGRVGSAIAHGAISQGCKVILVDVDKTGLDQMTSGLNEQSFITIVADVGIPEEADCCIAVGTKNLVVLMQRSIPPIRARQGGALHSKKLKEHLNEDLSSHLGGAILFSQRLLEFSSGKGMAISFTSLQLWVS